MLKVSISGFQRKTGFLAAVASSKRPILVECGASMTICGFSTASTWHAQVCAHDVSGIIEEHLEKEKLSKDWH